MNETYRLTLEEAARELLAEMTQEEVTAFPEKYSSNDMHFTYGMYIRNRYLWNKRIVDFTSDPDQGSALIMKKMVELVVTEYR